MARTSKLLTVALCLSLLPLSLACKKKQPETSAPPAPVVQQPAAPAEVPAEVQEMALNFSRVYFDFDRSDLDASSKSALRSNADIMKQKTDIKIEIQGHADERGTTDYNLALGTRRAKAVQDYMKAEGIAESRLKIVSYGEERPLVTGSSESAWSKNRRAEFKITWGGDDDVEGTVP